MKTQIQAYLIQETADLIASEAPLGAVLKAEAEALARLIEAANDALAKVRESAIEEGAAAYTVSNRENPPNKARYIALHGQAAFDAHKTVTPVNRFGWLI